MAGGGNEPVSLCKYCNKSVVNNSLKCINCNSVFHPSCAARVKCVKVGGNDVMCCGGNNSEIVPDNGVDNGVLTVLPEPDGHLKRENMLLKQLLCSKDEVIDALREEIQLLKDKMFLMDEIKLLKRKTDENIKPSYSDSVKKVGQEEKNADDKKKTGAVQKTVIKETKEISGRAQKYMNDNDQGQSKLTADFVQQALKKVNKHMMEHKQQEIMNEIVNLADENEMSTADDGGFKLVHYRRNKPGNNLKSRLHKNKIDRSKFDIAVGTGAALADSNFRSRPSKMWLFIGRVNEGVDKEAVVEYIRSKCSISDSDELIVNKLDTRGKSLAFQVGIDKQYYDQLTIGDFWPQGIIVKRYNFWISRRFKAGTQEQKTDGADFLDTEQNTSAGV